MEKEFAAYLADMVIEQFKRVPLAIVRMALDREGLIAILSKAPAPEDHKKKMQVRVKTYRPREIRGSASTEDISDYEIPRPSTEGEGLSLKVGGGLILQSFSPRRILFLEQTGFQPDTWEKRGMKIQDWLMQKRIYPADDVICRKFRTHQPIQPIIERIRGEGNKYGVMAIFRATLDIPKEHHGGDITADIPLFLCPGTTERDVEEFARYSALFQRPTRKDISYIGRQILKAYLYPKTDRKEQPEE